MITDKKHTAPNGLAGFRVFAGDNCLGTIFYFPDGPMTWKGVAPDGTRFSDASKPEITQRLRVHAAATKAPPSPQTNLMGAELLTTIKEFARWHHLNEMTIAAGKTPSDSEIDFEVTAWNRITRALTTREGS